MLHVRGRVARGRLVVDEATELPDGDVDLVVVNGEVDGDVWDAEADLAIAARIGEAKRGDLVDADVVLARARAR